MLIISNCVAFIGTVIMAGSVVYVHVLYTSFMAMVLGRIFYADGSVDINHVWECKRSASGQIQGEILM